MKRIITDAEVAALPLGAAKDELLEEIMASSSDSTALTDPVASASPVDDGTLAPLAPIAPPGRRRRWAPALAAAAVVAVAGLAASTLARTGDDGPGRAADTQGAAAPAQQADASLAVLRADGWQATHVESSGSDGGVTYESGDRQLEIRWKQASLHDDYVADRNDLGPAAPITVLGRPGKFWSYSADDHTVIREPQGRFFLEFRGSGMDQPAYRDLLTRLVAIAPDDLAAQLPARFVTDTERPAAVARLLQGVPLPDGVSASTIKSTQVDPYQLGVDVYGVVTCGWVEQFLAARDSGDADGVRAAQEAMATSRSWRGLAAMAPEGDYPSSVYDTADRLGRGQIPESYPDGMGC